MDGTVSLVTRAGGVYVTDTEGPNVAYGPTLDTAIINFRLVAEGRDELYQARQTAYIDGEPLHEHA